MDGSIEGDAALGTLSSAPAVGGRGGAGSSDMIEQAMHMFQSARPFAPAQGQVGAPGQRPPRRDGRGPSSSSSSSRGGEGRGRGSYSRGRSGRGRGRQSYSGPGANRHGVSSFIVSHGMRQLIGQFASETLVHTLQQHNYLTMMQMEDDEVKASFSIPETIQLYHSICPLENIGQSLQQPSRVVPVPTLCIKAIHHGDGAGYMLRRIDGRQVVPTSELLDTCKEVVLKWSEVANHPNVVGLREAFVSEEMLDIPSLYLSFDYHPGACSLEQLYIRPSDHSRESLTEDDVWSFLVQMTSALRAIHSAGMDAGPAAFHPSKILVCTPRRIRFGFLGVAEILMGPRSTDIPTAQLVDLTSLGSLLLTIACAAKNEPPSMDVMMSYFSRELCHVIAGLVASQKGQGFKTWRNVAAALGPRLMDELDTNQQSIDTMTVEMCKEIENGRISRFLIKLNTVVERTQLMGDTRWAETGDRYLLKLFRDFVFHQVDDDGHPLNDWGLIVDAINKADAGVHEKIMLLSRDESSMLVVSYADIKRCLLAAYEEIKRNSKPLQR